MRSVLLFAFSSMAVLACDVRELPPAAAPAKEMPRVAEVPTSPPPAGSARFVLDANGERAHVVEVMGYAEAYGSVGGHRAYSSSVVTRPVCSTLPCVADLQNGEHRLIFESDMEGAREDNRADVVDVRAADAPKVVRRTIGWTEHPVAGQVGGGVMALGVLSAAFCWIPFLGAATTHDQGSKDTWNNAGYGMAIGGGIAIVVGTVLMIAGRPEHTPGSTTEWTMPAPAQDAPAVPVRSAMARF